MDAPVFIASASSLMKEHPLHARHADAPSNLNILLLFLPFYVCPSDRQISG